MCAAAAQRTRGHVLVVYYSRTGNTARVAWELALRLGADLEEIRDRRERRGLIGYCRALHDSVRKVAADIDEPQKDPADYDLTIVGTPVWAWSMSPAVRAYLRKERDRVRAIAFFVTSGATQAERIVPRMEDLAGRSAVACAGFDARAMQDPAARASKIGAFVAALKNGSAPRAAAVASA